MSEPARHGLTIAVFGLGQVGRALAERWHAAGHQILIAGARKDSPTAREALKAHPDWVRLDGQEAVNRCDLAAVALPYSAVASALESLAFRGKPLIDCTNPVGAGVTHALASRRSGSEEIQDLVPGAHVVKAFTVYGWENFVDPPRDSSGRRPTLPLCGNHAEAKSVVAQLVEAVGFEALDVGNLSQALHLEHMTLLWVKMVRVAGRDPHFAWSVMTGPSSSKV